MAVTTFIPEYWERVLLRALRSAQVFGQSGVTYTRQVLGANAGDTVHINSLGALTVFDYVPNTDMPAPEALATTDQTLVLNQRKGFNVQLDDVDAAFAAGELVGPMREQVSFQLAEISDLFMATTIAAGVPVGNTIGTAAAPTALTAANIYDTIVDLRTRLGTKVPFAGRWIAVSSAVMGLLLKSDEFQRVGGDNGAEAILNGMVGRIAGFNVLEADSIPSAGGASTTQVIAGHAMATRYAEGINDVRAYQPERRFSTDAIKALHVYGAKVVQPNATAKIIATT